MAVVVPILIQSNLVRINKIACGASPPSNSVHKCPQEGFHFSRVAL